MILIQYNAILEFLKCFISFYATFDNKERGHANEEICYFLLCVIFNIFTARLHFINMFQFYYLIHYCHITKPYKNCPKRKKRTISFSHLNLILWKYLFQALLSKGFKELNKCCDHLCGVCKLFGIWATSQEPNNHSKSQKIFYFHSYWNVDVTLKQGHIIREKKSILLKTSPKGKLCALAQASRSIASKLTLLEMNFNFRCWS